MTYRKNSFVWLDLEMTGLNPTTDFILEVALLVTTDQLEISAVGPDLIINQPTSVLSNMNKWCTDQHSQSGLITKVIESQLSCAQAQDLVYEFLAQNCIPESTLLCGNSIALDRAFLRIHMPKVESFFHYRTIDVSTVKELIRRWYPNNPNAFFQKNETHRAFEDIQESIAELAHYKKHFFIL